MNTLSVNELAGWISTNKDFQLIDVREQHEHALFNIGGVLLPLPEIIANIGVVNKDKPVVFYCRVGVRSQMAIQKLQQKFPFDNLYNLAGGIEAWQQLFPQKTVQ